MDSQVAQLLALHCQPLLPPGSAELDVTHSVQIAALAGTGLLHMGSAQRHLVEVLLKEIGETLIPESARIIHSIKYVHTMYSLH